MITITRFITPYRVQFVNNVKNVKNIQVIQVVGQELFNKMSVLSELFNDFL